MSLTSAKQDTDVMAEINITPFTDVLLVLLIIFMILAALAAPPGFQKDLRSSKVPATHNPKDQIHSIEVLVNAHNVIYIDGRKTSEARLYNDMATTITYHRAHASQNYTDHIALTADSAASYNTIIKILDAARQAKDDDVGLVTE